jgi:hypothetical protein
MTTSAAVQQDFGSGGASQGLTRLFIGNIDRKASEKVTNLHLSEGQRVCSLIVHF